MSQNKLVLRIVKPDEPEWAGAVRCKRERAYRQLMENDGLAQQEFEPQYESFQQTHGIALHDKALRDEVANGHLIIWWRGETFLGYASVLTSSLLGITGRRVFNVLDVCLEPDATETERRQVVSDSLDQAREQQAIHVQIECDDVLMEANQWLGGLPVRHAFQFQLGL